MDWGAPGKVSACIIIIASKTQDKGVQRNLSRESYLVIGIMIVHVPTGTGGPTGGG